MYRRVVFLIYLDKEGRDCTCVCVCVYMWLSAYVCVGLCVK